MVKSTHANVAGRFYFKLTANGNLLGEYSNDKMDRSSTEAANRVPATSVRDPSPLSRFAAEYESVWRESGEKAVCADLVISPKPGSADILLLEWKSPKGGTEFCGEGMLCDDVLVGNYWSFPAAVGANSGAPAK